MSSLGMCPRCPLILNKSSELDSRLRHEDGRLTDVRVRRFTLLLPALLLVALPAFSQTPKCKRFMMWDTQLPVYPAIARAANMSATIRFTVEVPAEGEAQLSFLDGPSKGVWQTLAKSAHDYLSARKYGWFEGEHPKPCSYIASVEFREAGEAINSPNNFFRVTVEDEMHTVVEVKPTVPTVNY